MPATRSSEPNERRPGQGGARLEDPGRLLTWLTWPLLALALLLALATGAAPPKWVDFRGSSDPELFTRMPNTFLPYSSSFLEKEFDAYEFRVLEGTRVVRKRVEGHYTQRCYYFDPSAGPQPSPLQIMRNYQNAAVRIGGKVLLDPGAPGQGTVLTLLVEKGVKQTWAEVTPVNSGRSYYLRILERQAMRQAVTADADAMRAGLAQTGHVEVPGILFDTGRSEVKAGSEPALAQVEKLLQASPLRLWVVGHTDWAGAAEANVALAQARALAVIQALVEEHGVDARRLAPFGAGPYAPVAPNDTEEGRARNRRVELVAQPSP